MFLYCYIYIITHKYKNSNINKQNNRKIEQYRNAIIYQYTYKYRKITWICLTHILRKYIIKLSPEGGDACMERKELLMTILGQLICPLLVELIKIILLKITNKNKKEQLPLLFF